MDLALEYTFSKAQLDADVKAGRYDNIRLFQYGDMGTKYEELVPTFVTTQGTVHDPTDSGGTWANLTTASRLIGKPVPITYNLFSQFSATCFYFAAELTDHLRSKGSSDVPIGLIQSAIGGSQIEAWTPDTVLGACKNASLNADGQAPPGRLYNGMIAPFVNMTIAGWLWYQGENNCGGTVGNSKDGVGYGCQLPVMVAEWRRQWSATRGTTNPVAPFGVVTLAAGGSEGHDMAMAGMRWSQTGNYGKLPNQVMPNTFLAHAYDLGDPMDNLRAPCINTTSGAVNTSAFGPGGMCVWPAAASWNPAVAPLRDEVFLNRAPSFMGGIHPRFKREVGRRLAVAFQGTSGPTLSGCSMSQGKESLQLLFDATEPLKLQWQDQDYNMSNWGVYDSSSLMVCVSKPERNTVDASNCLDDASMWISAPLRSTFGSDDSIGTGIDVDLKGLFSSQQQVLAVRYGWPLSDGADTCCPSKLVRDGLMPCVPGSCPIMSSNSFLPANPFYATLVAGKCYCLPPQTCSKDSEVTSDGRQILV